MSPCIRMMGTPLGGFPRVSGDEPLLPNQERSVGVFSPRERG